MKKYLLLLLTTILSIVSYSQTIVIEVNSFGEYDMNGKTFVIIPLNNEIDAEDLEFKEYATYIKKILAMLGATESNKTDADLYIQLQYDITDKSYQETVSEAVYGQTTVSSITTNTNTTTTTKTDTKAKVSVYGNTAYGNAKSEKKKNENTNSTTNVTYNYGITGYKDVQQNVALFQRVMSLYAYENNNAEKPVMVWKSNLVSSGASDELREIVPAMSYAALGYIAVNANETINIKEKSDSYKLFCNLNINSKNIYIAPTVEYFSADENLKIVAIEKKPNETIVTFLKTNNIPTISISSKMFLEYNGNKIYPTTSENIKFDKIKKDKKNLLFNVHYPAIPKDVTSINISEEEDSNIKKAQDRKYWKGIQLIKKAHE